MTAAVVADASPLIAFQQIGQLALLRSLFTEIVIPSAVAREIRPSVPPVPWIVERVSTQVIAPLALRASLGPGESEALGLALEIRARLLLLDERAARRTAAALGLDVIGTLGILLAAKRRRLVAEVRPLLDDLIAEGFWVAPRLVEQVLSTAGEGAGSASG